MMKKRNSNFDVAPEKEQMKAKSEEK